MDASSSRAAIAIAALLALAGCKRVAAPAPERDPDPSPRAADAATEASPDPAPSADARVAAPPADALSRAAAATLYPFNCSSEARSLEATIARGEDPDIGPGHRTRFEPGQDRPSPSASSPT